MNFDTYLALFEGKCRDRKRFQHIFTFSNCLYGLKIFSKDPYANLKPKSSHLFRK